MKLAITIIVCLFIGYVFSNARNTQNSRNVPSIVRTVPLPSVNSLSEHANIDSTLRLVAENWKKTDVNQDGKHNCVDAAVLFYQYYPDKSKVCIELNNNPNTRLNHLFNCVFTDGVWKAIEPQSYATSKLNYLMWSAWGNQYDPSYNRDVTSEYIKYVRK